MANVKNGALQDAIDKAAVGEIVVLTSDITLDSRVNVSSIVTIDLNGYTIIGNIKDSYGSIYVGTKGILTIIDSSLRHTGTISNNVGHAIGNYGVVNIYSGTFRGNYALYNFFYNSDVYGTSVIYNGMFRSVGDNSIAIANCGDLTINGGDIENIDSTSVLNITGGSINSLYVGMADYSPAKQSTSISGGTLTNMSVANDSNNEIVISGGVFNCEVDNSYLADGFDFTYNESTGTYVVNSDSNSVSSGLKVIATSSSRIKDLVIRDNQLIFMRDKGRIAFDSKGKRVFYNQIVEVETEAERLALVNPIGGYYFVIGSACLWFYKNGWTQITTKPEEIIFIGVELPELGQENKLYVNTTDGNENISVWVDDLNGYKVVADKTQAMTSEDVIALFNK